VKGVDNMAQINISIDEVLKEKAELLFEDLGLNMSTAFNIFIRQSIREGGIPFEVTTNVGTFFSETNMRVLKESIEEANQGKFISKSIEELRELE
jgi:DNA-damage-inducible protein J